MQAVYYANDDQNPQPLMNVALVFIILSFVIGIPIIIVYFTVYDNN